MKMPSAMPFVCTCAPVFRGGLAEVVHANGKIELNVWTAGVATQSSHEPKLSGRPQLGESMSDVGMAVGFGVQAAKKHISYIRGLSRFIFLWSKSSSFFSLVEVKVLLSTLRVFARCQIEKFSLFFHWRSTAMQCKGERGPVICSVFKPL